MNDKTALITIYTYLVRVLEKPDIHEFVMQKSDGSKEDYAQLLMAITLIRYELSNRIGDLEDNDTR